MLSNMYSPVSKYSPEARKRMTYRSRQGKSCGYYMRIVFFFSSLIQTLIIIGLVLFVIYGKQQDSVDRVQDLEVRFSQLSIETMSLRQQRQNLTHLLNVTAMQQARDQFDLAKMRFTSNISYILLEDMEKKLRQCNFERASGRVNCPTDIKPINPYPFPGSGCNCGSQMETLRMKMELIQSNFTQTAMQMQLEIDQTSSERDNLNLDVIQLRRDKSMLEKAIQFYQMKCKEEFVNSLSGISNVSKAFLTKIDSLFHSLSPFHLSCEKQKDYLEQIRTNCTDLSEEVVNKFQTYLDVLGDRVSMSQGNISVLMAENIRMTRDYNLCSQNRTSLIREHKQNVQRIQLKYDEEKETMLKERLKLKGQIEVLENSVKFKISQLDHVNEQLKHLNMSCITRSGGLFPRLGSQPGSTWNSQLGPSNPGFSNSNSGFSNSNSGFSNSNSGFPNSNTGLNRNSFGSSSSSSSSSSLNSKFGSSGLNTGLGSSNLGLNKPSSTGLGSSSLGSNSGLGSSSTNKLGSNNQGSSSSFGLGSSGSSLNKQTSTGLGLGSSGSSLNKQTSTGLGLGSSSSSSSSSSTFGSLFGSSNNPSSSISNQNKFGSSVGTGSSSSTGSSFGSSSSNQGSSSSSLGSNFGSSSNSGLGSSSSSSLSKPSTNSRGSSNNFFGSSSSSSSSSLGSSSSSQNKLSTSLNKGSSSSSSSSSSTGSSTTASKGFGSWGWLGGGSSSSNSNSNSNSDQSKSVSNQGRGTSNTGNSFGSFGKSSTFSFTGPLSVSQHLRDLQRIINPPGPEEKQELSRMMG